MEMARAAAAVARAGLPLVHLVDPDSAVGTAAAPRREVPIDVRRVSFLGFPPMKVSRSPRGRGKAAVLTTWWGTTGRPESRGPDPRREGVLASRILAIQQHHGPENVLIVSLEEFASCRDSSTVEKETLRQAGWNPVRIARHRRSPEGRVWRERYHEGFLKALGEEDTSVLHLAAGFAESRGGTKEFPFVLQVGPFGLSQLRAKPVSPGEKETSERPRILWYASSESSLDFAALLFGELKNSFSALDLLVRASPGKEEEWKSLPFPSGVRLTLLPEMDASEWPAVFRGANLVLVGGSQSLVDALVHQVPFLYFNGFFREKGVPSRAFRREKLLSLLEAWRAQGVSPRVRRDLRDFADGRNTGEILLRALRSDAWRRAELAPMRRPRTLPWSLQYQRRDGDLFLVEVLRGWTRHPGPVGDFVTAVRRRRFPPA